MTVFAMLVSMLCLISCSNNGEKQGIHSDRIEIACSDVDSFLGSDIDTDTVATKHGVYMFRRCLNDSVYVHCIAGSVKTIFAFSCYHGGYSIDVVDYESGGVGFTISESGYGHSQEDVYKVKFVDGIGTCLSALTTSEYSLYSSDPEKFYSYGIDILADTLLIEHLEDECEAIKTSSRVKIQYANS